MTETESFNIAFDLSKISLFRRWNITKSYCIYYECEKQKETTIFDRRLSFLFVLVSFQYSLFTFH